MSENAKDLQNAFTVYAKYCNVWKFAVYNSKSTMYKGRQHIYRFTLNIDQIYIGALFCSSCSFFSAKRPIAAQANKACFNLLLNANRLHLPIDLQIDLFSKTVNSIVMCGSEIWGYRHIDIIERAQLKFEVCP